MVYSLIYGFIDAPEILPLFISSVTAIEGRDKVLDCAAVGNPVPRVTWLFGGEELPAVLSNGSVLLSSVQVNNEGNYTCRVTNPLGSAEATLTLVIQGEIYSATITLTVRECLIYQHHCAIVMSRIYKNKTSLFSQIFNRPREISQLVSIWESLFSKTKFCLHYNKLQYSLMRKRIPDNLYM